MNTPKYPTEQPRTVLPHSQKSKYLPYFENQIVAE